MSGRPHGAAIACKAHEAAERTLHINVLWLPMTSTMPSAWWTRWPPEGFVETAQADDG